jgi:hypothetical protein
MWQTRSFSLINPKFQFGPSVGRAANKLTIDPSAFTDVAISPAEQPSLKGGYRYTHNAPDLQATMRNRETFASLPENSA